MLLIFLFIIHFSLSGILGSLASDKGYNFWTTFLISFFLSSLGGLMYYLLVVTDKK